MQQYLLAARLVREGFLQKVIVELRSEGHTGVSHEQRRASVFCTNMNKARMEKHGESRTDRLTATEGCMQSPWSYMRPKH